MRIGTDCSLMVCLNDGYTVMDFKVRGLYPRGRKNGIDRDYAARFSASYPEYMRKDMACERDPFGMRRAWEASASWNDLQEIYGRHKAGVYRFADFEHCPLNWAAPNEYDLLILADVLHAYCGLY